MKLPEIMMMARVAIRAKCPSQARVLQDSQKAPKRQVEPGLSYQARAQSD